MNMYIFKFKNEEMMMNQPSEYVLVTATLIGFLILINVVVALA